MPIRIAAVLNGALASFRFIEKRPLSVRQNDGVGDVHHVHIFINVEFMYVGSYTGTFPVHVNNVYYLYNFININVQLWQH